MDAPLIRPLALALGLGLLVGLQRERTQREIGGIRTFPMITMLGLLCAQLAASFGGWVVGAGLLVLGGLLVLANVLGPKAAGDAEVGLTTEVAALLMFGVGAALQLGFELEAVVVGGVIAVLLQAKEPLHRAVRALSDQEVRAIFQFVLLALVVLPLLPDEGFGPFEVINPFRIWLVVVLIVGISTAAWGAARILGRRRGTALTGVLGGLISSTATTVSRSRLARTRPREVGPAAFVILMASATAIGRVILEIGLVARGSLLALAPPLAVLLVVLLVAALVQWRRQDGGSGEEDVAAEAASDLRTAIAFGLLYTLVLLGVAAARRYLGEAGLYAVAALSGLTDMDAITLSTAQLVEGGSIEPGVGWRVILVGGMMNLVFKGGVVAALGPVELRRPVLAGFLASLAVGGALLAFWP